jgi:hypothetical protein
MNPNLKKAAPDLVFNADPLSSFNRWFVDRFDY